MRYLALATDYDGTLAEAGIVADTTVQALRRLRESGRKLILVTGRELPDLQQVFPYSDLFDRIVAENGAVSFDPATRNKRVLATLPPPSFIASLKARNLPSISVGEVIVATYRPYESAVFETIRQLGLDLEVIFNKESVMVLPAGIDKLTGLQHVLSDLNLSPNDVVAVGDAENDESFLSFCQCSVAVSNATPDLKEKADLVTNGARGDGVAELISLLLEDDLESVPLKVEN